MSLAAALIYWVIVALWLTILGTIVFFYVRNPHAFGATRLLLAVLAVDAIRNILENIYFGRYFGSVYHILPAQFRDGHGPSDTADSSEGPQRRGWNGVLCLLLWR